MKVVERDSENIVHLKTQILYHLNEIYALQVETLQAVNQGKMINTTNLYKKYIGQSSLN